MKIIIFNFEYPPLGGGGGIATKHIAEELAKKHEVHVITSRPTKELGEAREKDGGGHMVSGVHVHRVPVLGRESLAVASLLSMATFIPSAWWKARQLTRNEKFDVINAQFVIPSGIPAALIARRHKIPMVLSFIGGDLFDPTKGVSPHRHWILRQAINFISNQAKICTAISHDTKRRAVDIHKVTRPIVVINLGITAGQPRGRKTRAELHLPESTPLFVSVGRLIPRKGYGCLLEALTQTPAAHLAVMGDGPLLNQLKKQAYDLGVHERVHWLGFVSEEDKMNILDRADVFVSASEHEGFGIVFLEAMESGLPIIATWEGGQTDFLFQGHNALLVRPRDNQAMARAMRTILENQEMRDNMRNNNKEEVKNYYWPQVGNKYEEVMKYSLEDKERKKV